MPAGIFRVDATPQRLPAGDGTKWVRFRESIAYQRTPLGGGVTDDTDAIQALYNRGSSTPGSGIFFWGVIGWLAIIAIIVLI